MESSQISNIQEHSNEADEGENPMQGRNIQQERDSSIEKKDSTIGKEIKEEKMASIRVEEKDLRLESKGISDNVGKDKTENENDEIDLP